MRSFIRYYDGKIKQNVVDKACSTDIGNKTCIDNFLESLKRKYRSVDLRI
jgi:hypothetical protein